MIHAALKKNLQRENAELSVLKTLAYFDIFNYPLSEKEIRNFLPCPVSEQEFQHAIKGLLAKKIIFKFGPFYSLQDSCRNTESRKLGNLRAQHLLPKAYRIGAFLYKFPYVRAVAISGSLSKHYADEKADIDFFIITRENRLWIARTFLHIFKKLTYLSGRQHDYCMNYFIDEQAVAIPEQNIYSATEIVTLLPVAGLPLLNKFFTTNDWTGQWFPNHTLVLSRKTADKNSFVKKIFESILNTNPGTRIENFLFQWTTRRWKKKAGHSHRNSKGKIMNLQTGKHFSKSDPEEFQSSIVALYGKKIFELEQKWIQSFHSSLFLKEIM